MSSLFASLPFLFTPNKRSTRNRNAEAEADIGEAEDDDDEASYQSSSSSSSDDSRYMKESEIMIIPVHQTFLPHSNTRRRRSRPHAKAPLAPLPPPVHDLICHADDGVSLLTNEFDTASHASASTSTQSVGLNPYSYSYSYYGPVSVGGIPNHDLARRWTQPSISQPQKPQSQSVPVPVPQQGRQLRKANKKGKGTGTGGARSRKDKVHMVGSRRHVREEGSHRISVGAAMSGATSGAAAGGGSPQTVSSKKVHLGNGGTPHHEHADTDELLVKTLQSAAKISLQQKDEDIHHAVPPPPPMVHRKKYSGSQFQFSPHLASSSLSKTCKPTANASTGNASTGKGSGKGVGTSKGTGTGTSKGSGKGTPRTVVAPLSNVQNLPSSAQTRSKECRHRNDTTTNVENTHTKHITAGARSNHTGMGATCTSTTIQVLLDPTTSSAAQSIDHRNSKHNKQSFLSRLSLMKKRGPKCSSQIVVDLDSPPCNDNSQNKPTRTTTTTTILSSHSDPSKDTTTSRIVVGKQNQRSTRGKRYKKDIWAPDVNDVFVNGMAGSESGGVVLEPPSCVHPESEIRNPTVDIKVKKGCGTYSRNTVMEVNIQPRKESLEEIVTISNGGKDQTSDPDSLSFLSFSNRDDDDDSLLLFLSKGDDEMVEAPSTSKPLSGQGMNQIFNTSTIQMQQQRPTTMLDSDVGSLCYSESHVGTYFSASTLEGIKPGNGISSLGFEWSEESSDILSETVDQCPFVDNQSETGISSIDQEAQSSKPLVDLSLTSSKEEMSSTTSEQENAAKCIQARYRGFNTRYHLLKELGIAKRRKWEKRSKSIQRTKIHSNIRREARDLLRDRVLSSNIRLTCPGSIFIGARTVCAIIIQRWWKHNSWLVSFTEKCQKNEASPANNMQSNNSDDEYQKAAILIQSVVRAMVYRNLFKSEQTLRNTFTSKEWEMRRQIVRFKMSRLSGIVHEVARSPPSTPCRPSDQHYDLPVKKHYMPKKTRKQDDNKWFDPENFPSSWKRSLFDQSDERGSGDSTEFTWDLWGDSEGLNDRQRDEKSPASSRACDTTWSLSDEEYWDSFDSFPQSEPESDEKKYSLDHIKEETFEQIWSVSDDDMSTVNLMKQSDIIEEIVDKRMENIFVQENDEEEDLFSREGEKEGTISLLSKMRNGKMGRFVKIFGNSKKTKRNRKLFKRRNMKNETYHSAVEDKFEGEGNPKQLDPLTLYAPLNDDNVPFDEI